MYVHVTDVLGPDEVFDVLEPSIPATLAEENQPVLESTTLQYEFCYLTLNVYL